MSEREAEAEAVRNLRLRFANDVWTDHIDKWVEHVKPRFANRELVEVLEVGSLEGRSAIWLARNIPAAVITCVDLFDVAAYENNFDYNIVAAGVARQIMKLKGLSEHELVGLPAASYDLIYVDANHDAPNVLTDAVLCWRLLKQGGLLVFDDYLLEVYTPYGKDGPRLAIDNFISTYARQLNVIETGWQVFIEKL